jgi:CBS domain-containing protein
MKIVKQILTQKPSYFNVIAPKQTVIEALRIMKRENLSYVIVMEDEKYLGIMSEKDYSRKVILEGKDSSNTIVKDIMETDMPFVDINDTSDKCLAMMGTFNARYLPVLEDQHFRGVITIHDVMRVLLAEKIDTQSLNLINDSY